MWPFHRTRRSDPTKFASLATAFRRDFPQGDLTSCDFRPHFNGNLIDAWSPVTPQADAFATWDQAIHLLEQIADWLRAHADEFGDGDRIQLIVGFDASVKKEGRQIFKCWLPANRLRDLRGVDFAAAGGALHERKGWSFGVEWPGSSKP